MNKPMIKNIIICALAVTCAVLTVRLWFGNFAIHGLFPGEPVVAASPAHQRMAMGMIESGQMTINLHGEEQERHVLYSGLRGDEAWRISVRALSALIDEGSFDRSGVLDEAALTEIFSRDNIVVQYNFAMPTSFFREQFGRRPGFLSSVFGSFESLVIVPDRNAVDFYFISGTNGGENTMFHAFVLEDEQIYYDFREHFLERSQIAETQPEHNDQRQIFAHNPIGEQMLHADVRPFVLFFFPNPATASAGTTINGVYTYVDSYRVVKFYPNNVAEYIALLDMRSSGAVSLASSLLAALDMLDRDRAAMLGQGEPMNDVFLVGYSVGPAEGQWNFYFDYVVGGRPMAINEVEGVDVGILEHAVEISVANNAVVQYRRLMLNFFEAGESL